MKAADRTTLRMRNGFLVHLSSEPRVRGLHIIATVPPSEFTRSFDEEYVRAWEQYSADIQAKKITRAEAPPQSAAQKYLMSLRLITIERCVNHDWVCRIGGEDSAQWRLDWYSRGDWAPEQVIVEEPGGESRILQVRPL